MTPFLTVVLKLSLVLLIASVPLVYAQGESLSEPMKIQLLLEYIKETENAKFIRDGTPYRGEEAVAFLCDVKWAKKPRSGWRPQDEKKIQTLEAFMTKVVGRSERKTPYQVEFDDGKRSTLHEYLTKYLKEVLNNEQSPTKPNFSKRHPCMKE